MSWAYHGAYYWGVQWLRSYYLHANTNTNSTYKTWAAQNANSQNCDQVLRGRRAFLDQELVRVDGGELIQWLGHESPEPRQRGEWRARSEARLVRSSFLAGILDRFGKEDYLITSDATNVIHQRSSFLRIGSTKKLALNHFQGSSQRR